MLVVPLVSMEEFVLGDARHIAGIFAMLVIVLYPLRLAIDWLWAGLDPQTIPVVNSGSYINRTFAGHSFEIFGLLFVLLSLLKVVRVNCQVTDLETDRSPLRTPTLRPDSKTDSLLRKLAAPTVTPVSAKETNNMLFVLHGAKLIVLYLPLTVCIITSVVARNSLFELIQRWTGGQCSNPALDGYRACLVDGGHYTGGFKVSGHCLITTTFSLFLLWEGYMWKAWTGVKTLPERVLATAVCVVLVIWTLLFTITCLFYHTFPERLIGTGLGTGLFYLCYCYLCL